MPPPDPEALVPASQREEYQRGVEKVTTFPLDGEQQSAREEGFRLRVAVAALTWLITVGTGTPCSWDADWQAGE
jgi:hypothetical protein